MAAHEYREVGTILNYKTELTAAMQLLSADARTRFVGQSVRYGGQAMSPTFEPVPMARRIEMPVAEEFQMGFCTGLALAGFVPVSVYTRWDFLIIAANQLINHLDKLPLLSDFTPKVIVRVAVGATKPINAGLQHVQNYTKQFNSMLHTVQVIELMDAGEIVPAYECALQSAGSFLIVEHMNLYQSESRLQAVA